MGRILVVDDEEGLREFLVEALEAAGHEAVAKAEPKAALAELARRSFDLLISDQAHIQGKLAPMGRPPGFERHAPGTGRQSDRTR